MGPPQRNLLVFLSVFCLNGGFAPFAIAETGIPKGAASLVFVFDTTGSMYDDLVQVRAGASRILSTTLERKIKPLYNYALIPFHDPDVGPAVVTTSPEKFQQHLDDLFVQGGGDCPEMTLSAIMLALEISLPGSFIYVFTDSHAKDFDLTQKVVRLIQQKQSQVIFVVTGDCGNQTLSPGFTAFELISATSSGQVFRLKKKDVNQVLKFVEESVQANRVNLLSTDVGEPADRTYMVPVDNTLRELTISMSGKDASLKLYDPAGNLVTEERGLQKLLNLKGVKIVSVEKPRPGLWNLTTSSKGSHTLRITGYSSMHFFSGFGLRPIRSQEEAVQRPVAGFRNFALIKVNGLEAPGAAQRVQLLNLQGQLIREVPFKPRHTDRFAFDWLDFEPPRELFYVRVLGVDDDQNVFHRASPTALSAVLPDPPKVRAPATREVLSGSSVKLWCTVETAAPAKIQWTMGQRTLGPVLTRIGTVNVSHVIRSVSPKDQGPFSCFASNIGGTDTTITSLIVKVPRSVRLERSHSNLTAETRETFILTCAPYDATPVSLLWRKDGRDLKSSELTTPLANGSLLLHIHSRKDAGRYECIARNKGREEVRALDIEVYERPFASIDTPTKTFQSGSDVSVTCHVSGYPVPSLVWYKDSQQLEPGGRLSINKENVLQIRDAQMSDSGLYECVVWNIAGQSQATVTLEYTIPPSVFVDREGVIAKAGDTVTVQCTASAKPVAQLTWFKGRTKITPDRRIAVSSHGHLVINAVQVSDGGFYTCLADNKAGQDSVTISIRVQIPPRVTVDSEEIPLVLGETLVVQCAAVGIPTPTVTWLKNEGALQSGDRISVSEQGVLVIKEALPQDAGTYHCVGSSPAGTATAVVIVRSEEVLPKITTPPSDKTVTIGGNVTFTCSASGVPKPYITWLNNLRIAADTDPRATVLPTGELVIRDIELKDAGRYVCTAENSLGRDSAQVTLTLTGLTPPIILKPAKTTIIAERGGTVELQCPTLGTPRPIISWRKNGQRIPIDGVKFKQLATGTLQINSLLPFDSGSYLCSARNRAGLDILGLALYVYIPPEIIRSPPNMTVDEGDTILMECVARGFPIPHIRWLLNNQTLPYNVSSIELSELTVQNAGVYQCVAENVAGKASATAVLSVRASPRIFQPKSTVSVLSGSPAQLNCNVSGNPKPSVTWSRQGVPIPSSNPKYLVLPSGSLLIFDVLPSDSGTYVCEARNPLGRARHPSELLVQVPPEIIEPPQNISIDEGDTIILKCMARGFPAPYMMWYLNDIALLANSSVVEISGASKTEHEGLYRCEAQNPAGSVSASAVVTVRGKDDNVAQGGSPEFVHKPQDAEVDAGSNLLWDCTATGEPKPVMKWTKDGKEFLPAGFPQHIRVLANNSLTISGARPEDEGQYQCRASNGFGAHVVLAKLVVRVNGGWSDWQDWGDCSRTCGTGSQHRYRTCDNPVPGHRGRQCPGTNVELQPCNLDSCSVDGQWSPWTEWTLCSKVCDRGEQTRYRECNNPPALFNGTDCQGHKRDSRPCNLFKCPDGVGVAIGQVHGTVNKVMLPNLFLLANLTKTSTNDTQVSCSVSGMPGPIRNWLKSSSIPLTAPVYWATAGEKPGAENGLTITNGRFVYKTRLDFKTGETLLVEHRGQGVNEKGVFVIDVDIKGGTPKFPAGARVTFPNFEEKFIQTGVGEISSSSERVVSVDGVPVPYSCNSTIAYSPTVSKQPRSLSQTVQVTAVDISYPDQSDTLKIDMTAVVQRATVPDQCPDGLIKDPSSRYCRDVNECVAVPRVCSQYCDNLFGSFRCSCSVGHVLAADGKTCNDIDECSLGTASCPSGQQCVNTPGAYRCRLKCDDGYVMLENEACVDIDECEFARTTDSLDRNDPCLHSCENLPGSYRCSCKDGYELKDDLCKDIDECAARVCDHGCQNQKGNFSCFCYQGYRLISDSQCADVDECTENSTICGHLQCVNVPGSFQCLGKCDVGFKRTMDDKECVDINECSEGQHNCKLTQMCMNTVGSFYCVCPRGYSALTPQSPCEDVNECQQFQGICEFQCVNSVGSFECLCPAGGVLNPDQRTCAGVDGCAFHNLKCEQRCAFSAQGYHCSCSRGYRLADNKQNCVDVDECASNKTNSCQFACTNTLGSFKCRCPVGYYISPDGTKCLDVDECSLTGGPCNRGQCFNTRGSYRCLPSVCPRQYHQVGGGFCVNQCSSPGYCASQAARQQVITLPLGVSANTNVARLVPFFPPYMATMRYYCQFQYSFSINPSPFALRMLANEVVIYTKQEITKAGIHQMQVTANLFYMDGTLACRTVFTVFIDVAKFSF